MHLVFFCRACLSDTSEVEMDGIKENLKIVLIAAGYHLDWLWFSKQG